MLSRLLCRSCATSQTLRAARHPIRFRVKASDSKSNCPASA
ncbi:hypothetical protein BUH_6776 [Burkholderia pseudomallei Pakistan 9]|nr:hypothetical protein BUH_6776 [Burkholderia pseudomallei Pakistan 9]